MVDESFMYTVFDGIQSAAADQIDFFGRVKVVLKNSGREETL
jgi:hypothetical protein